jgi:acyl-CoA synthetase (AMP-forming)/AMP-acid ligase II
MIAGDLLGERVRLTPTKTALAEVQSGRRFTYHDLDRRAAAMAYFLDRYLRAKQGDRGAILPKIGSSTWLLSSPQARPVSFSRR